MTNLLEARARLAELRGLGLGVRQIAKLAGVDVLTVRRIASGKVRRPRPETIAALMGVRPKPAAGALVNAYSTRRLLKAIRAEGFTEAQIAARLGLRGHKVGCDSKLIRARSAARIRALFRQVTEDV